MLTKNFRIRVWRWRVRVEKWISFTASLETFLVPAYVTKIADHLNAKKENEADFSAIIDFRDMVRGRRKHDVCRLFLTTLILANRHSFEIRNTVDSDGTGNLMVNIGETAADLLTQE
eukprot:Gregarina_sp_Poly_1__11073@NODE_890_length_5837_cov_53_476430_g634_i0_p7_GENE_NODE_890_length_5837_cov_53_476430_g634_i0NODE_890_length_5837_cov_53_476430_g634_i0_p7_ORF_typecomplete_len117_score10_14CNDH2_C/PF16858_5/1_1e16DUF1679/PF07914_11/0_02Rad21_Rec8/PF04824_16/0_075Xol1_N/PF09108_10/0_078WWE/PF02825_20/0_15_NODE_890_length_5837_cov_53_476430_g634_i022452595